MLNKPKKTEFIGIRCTKETMIELQKIAEETDRSISYIVNLAIDKFISTSKGDVRSIAD